MNVAERPKPRLPVENPCTSYWLANARSSLLIGHRTTAELPSDAEVVIIGSGMSGAVTAYFLMTGPKPPKNVVILEAREVCSGATGRNGGHCRPDSYQGYASYKEVFGKDQALKILENEAATLDLVESGIDVFLQEDVKTQARASLKEYTEDGGKLAGVTRWIEDAQQARKESRIKSAVGAAIYPAGSFYPYKFVSHLLNRCLERGINIQTTTLATSIVPAPISNSDSPRWTVATPRGSLTAEKVIHCTNAWSPYLLPILDNTSFLTPIKGACSSLTPPLSYSGVNMLRRSTIIFWGNGSPAFEYLIQRPRDGTVILGGGGPGRAQESVHTVGNADDSTGVPILEEALGKLMGELFEGWEDKIKGDGTERTWTGIMGYTKDHAPLLGPMPGAPGQYVCVGHNGHGMARIATLGKGLAQLVQGEEWAKTGIPECFAVTPERLATTVDLLSYSAAVA